MKKVLLVGKKGTGMPTASEIIIKHIELFCAFDLEAVTEIFKTQSIDIVIMGAGIDLEKRLEIVEYIFSKSDSVTIHLKDRATGPEGYLPFINAVLRGLLDS